MASQRMSGPILTSVSPATLFSGDEEFLRMKALRSKITDVRRIWQSSDEYVGLKRKIRSYIDHESHSPNLISKITKLLEGYSDWADMDYHRPEKQEQSFTAIELYCSEEGYNLLFGIFNAVLREKETSDEILLVAAALVELVTIELYNLRLSNIGDPRYENFQGVTFRGMCVSKEMAALYRKAASEPDLSKRSFGVPLGFTSSSTSRETTAEFTKLHPGKDQMHWIIHVHGLDPRLLKKYEEKYPDSVVTSITAMPVGKIAELREKEILLRGAFFHIVHMASEEKDGCIIHTLELVAMNANRDHGTELALDEGAKQEQRNFFRDMILASRYEICASLARPHSVVDSVGYEGLAKTALARIDFFDHRLTHGFTPQMPYYPTDDRATWYGDKIGHSFSTNFLALRNKFHPAAQAGKWNTVRDIIMGEYEWEIADWFNFQALGPPWRGRSLLHEMGSLGPAETSSEHSPGWEYLLEKLGQCDVWKNLRTADSNETAEDIARARGESKLADLLKPRSPAYYGLSPWEAKLHGMIKSMAGYLLYDHIFAMPQLSVLMDIKSHSMWIPIPKVYGGFSIMMGEDMRGISLVVTKIETIKGATRPVRTSYQLT